jgi:hypothetical protein
MTRQSKWTLGGIIGIFIAICILVYGTAWFIASQPEAKLAQEKLSSCKEVATLVGHIQTISPDDTEDSILRMGDSMIWTYRFDVAGEKGKSNFQVKIRAQKTNRTIEISQLVNQSEPRLLSTETDEIAK